MIAGISVDDWKVEIFKKVLGKAGFECIEQVGLMPGCTLLKVNTANIKRLKKYVQKAHDETERVGVTLN